MSKFDFSEGVARLSTAMTTGAGEVAERFGFDTPSFIWAVYNVVAEALGCSLVTFKDMAPAIAIPHGTDAFPNLQRIVKLPENKFTQDKKGKNTISRRQQRKLKLAGLRA